MEHVQLPLLSCTKGPGLNAVQECAQDTGSIDLDLGIHKEKWEKLLFGEQLLEFQSQHDQ